jgi:thioredoxin 2
MPITSETRHVVCPHCCAANRVKVLDLLRAPACVACQQALFEGHSVALDTASFDLHVDASELPVLVDFWAPWSGPCRTMAPAFEQAAAQLEPRVRLAKVNAEAEPLLAARFNARSIPTLVLFMGGPRWHGNLGQ